MTLPLYVIAMCCHLLGVTTPDAEIKVTPFKDPNNCPAFVCSTPQPFPLTVLRAKIVAKLVVCDAPGLIQASAAKALEFHAALSGTTIFDDVPLNEDANWVVPNGE